MALSSGQVLQQRYRIVALLGQGGMGAVYRAWDTRLKIHIALKEMVPQPGLDLRALTHLRQQFEQEAVILARLSHPHLVDVTDFFEESGKTYMVMRFIEGESLADRVEREGAQSEAQVLEWASQLLGALAYCHDQGIIHRDVKPQNVILRPDGRAVLVDFGLVKLWDPKDPRTKTAMRGMGTPEYAPPEQYDAAAGHTDPRSDVYSLGATLYHALTGQAPPTATQRIVDPEVLAPVEIVAPGVSAATAAAVARAIELRPVDRFQSAQQMAAALQGAAPAAARPAPPQPTKVLPGAQLPASKLSTLTTPKPLSSALAPQSQSAPASQSAQIARPWYKRTPVWIGVFALAACLMLTVVLGSGLIAAVLPGLGLNGDGANGRVPTEEPVEEPIEQPTEDPATEPIEEPTAEPTEEPREPIKIGLITDLTGALAIYGTMTQRSFLLGMEYATGAPGNEDNVFVLDGREIHVLIRDDQSTPETTAVLAHELIEVEGVDILVGTVSSGATAALQEIAAENEVVLIVAPAAANDITGANFNPYTFRTSRENYQDYINLCAYLTSYYDTFAQIAPDYSFGRTGTASARDACTYYGGEFVMDDMFAPADTTDFIPYLEQIQGSGAEAWIVTWAGGSVESVFEQAEELGLLDELGLGFAFFDNQLMQALLRPAIGQTSGIAYCWQCPDNEINDWLMEETVARYGVPPDLFDADGMNAAILAVEALRASGGVADADTLIGVMEGLEFEGPKGTVTIRPEDHVAVQDMYIVTLENLDDPGFAFYTVIDISRPEPPCLLPEGYQDRCGDLPIGSLGGP